MTEIALAWVPLPNAGSASGLVSTAQQLGAASGVAVIGVVFSGQLASHAPGSVDRVRLGFSHAAELALRWEVTTLLLVLLLSFLLPPKAHGHQARDRDRLRHQPAAVTTGDTEATAAEHRAVGV